MQDFIDAIVEEARPRILAEAKAEAEAEAKAKAKAEAEAEAKAKAKVEVFLRLAQIKFRGLPEDREAQAQAASTQQLDIWLDRILTATSLEEVFNGDDGDAAAVSGAPA